MSRRPVVTYRPVGVVVGPAVDVPLTNASDEVVVATPVTTTAVAFGDVVSSVSMRVVPVDVANATIRA
jgi:hypothetical protein